MQWVVYLYTLAAIPHHSSMKLSCAAAGQTKKGRASPAFRILNLLFYLAFSTMYSTAAFISSSEQLAQVPFGGITPVAP
jgi:hypothetical protein